MIQQNDVLHWQCSEDTPFMLQLLFNHLHLEHLSSVYLYGTQDLHRAFLTLSDSQFLLLTSHPKTPKPLLPLLFSSVLLNVGFGLPLCLFPFCFQVNATLQSLFWSCLRMCPTTFHHLFSIHHSVPFIPAPSSNSPFVTWSCHQMSRILQWYEDWSFHDHSQSGTGRRILSANSDTSYCMCHMPPDKKLP